MTSSRALVTSAFLVVCVALSPFVACGGASGERIGPSPFVSTPIPTSGGGQPLQPTTTLQAESGNNTSAASDFSSPGSGNASAANVSKMNIRSLLYPGSTTKIYAHLMGWFGGPSHMDVKYRSDDPAVVHRQVQDMVSRGIQGAIVDWHGPNAQIVNNTTLALRREAEATPGFEFAVMEDAGALFEAARANDCDVTSQFLSDLQYIASQFETSSAYIRINGKPVVFLFGVAGFYIDWDRVQAATNGSHIFVARGGEGLSAPYAQGAFQWVDINSNDPFDPQLTAQANFYNAAKATPARVAIASTYKGFSDPLAEWSTNRFINQRCGQTWLATFSEISKFYSASNQLPAMQVVTWNDYEEGTAIETGVDNCVFLTPSVSGNSLTWIVDGGDENTIDHYTVFISADGQNLAVLADVPSGTHGLDLARFNLGAGPYTLYVKAVGRPSIQNKVSPAIIYRPGSVPPRAVMTFTNTGPLSISVSTSDSTDPDGSIASSTIDFGDGTVVPGPTASHTYSAANQYDVTVTVVDNSGASSVNTQRITAKPTTPGVTLFTPTQNATVNWPTPVIATASSAGPPITSMTVLIDGERAYAIDRDVVNTPLKIFSGRHTVTVQAQDAGGNLYRASQSVVGEPNNLPPVARITLRPFGPPNTALACSVHWDDPDGFVIMYNGMFSDGTPFFSPAALHTFAGPGSFGATVTVTDQFGLTGTASANVNVGGSMPAIGTKVNVQPARQPRRVDPIRRP